MTSRNLLLSILRGEESERAAVVCPGGMMSLAVTEVMDASGAAWPHANFRPDLMLRLALAMQEATDFDNVALPFCMTVEAGAYGAVVDAGSRTTQPRAKRTLLPADGSGVLPEPDFAAGRAGLVLGALAQARAARPELALVGNLVGPFSLLGMLADPLQMLRWTRRKPDVLHRHLETVAGGLCEFARLQAEAGVDAICIAEPTATGDIVSAAQFRAFALPYLNSVALAVRSAGPAVIVHICGDVRRIRDGLFDLSADAVSFDSMVDVLALRAERPPWQVMGNVSAFLLESGPEPRIGRCCRALVSGGIRLIAPACGVVPATPVRHLRAMSETVRTGEHVRAFPAFE